MLDLRGRPADVLQNLPVWFRRRRLKRSTSQILISGGAVLARAVG